MYREEQVPAVCVCVCVVCMRVCVCVCVCVLRVKMNLSFIHPSHVVNTIYNTHTVTVRALHVLCAYIICVCVCVC